MKVIRIEFVLTFFSMSVFAASTEAPTKESSVNNDAPNILYVVPWSDAPALKAEDPKLVLHNLMGDLYEPQIPSDWQ